MADGEGDRRSQDKRQRLLEAAGEVFAQRGFKAATIQEISQRANANIASVNYHFRDKETLYHEVFRYALELSRKSYISYPTDPSEHRPAQRLKLEVRRYLHNMFSPDRAPWMAMMFFREMIEPTDMFESLIKEALEPYQKLMESLVREVVGAQADEHTVRFSACAAISLCGSFHSTQKYISKLYPGEMFAAGYSDELADLITAFVLGGMRALKLPSR